jgi:hypothetical protein
MSDGILYIVRRLSVLYARDACGAGESLTLEIPYVILSLSEGIPLRACCRLSDTQARGKPC